MMQGVIKLKLGAAAGMSRRRLNKQLLEACRLANRAKNAALWHWMAWRKTHPDWQPAQAMNKKGELKVDASGKPILESWSCSQELSKSMYRCARETSPALHTRPLSQAWSAVLKKLKDNVPYNHSGEARYVWQALLRHERSLDNYQSLVLPVATLDSAIYYRGSLSRSLSPGIVERVKKYAGNSAVVRFPIWSRQAGHFQTDIIARLHVGKLSRGHRNLLGRIANGTLKMNDSQLSQRDGKWFLCLVYEVPVVDHGLDTTRILQLTMGNETAFSILFPEGNSTSVGDDKPLLAEARRLEIRRKTIRYRSRHGHGRGHGKQRFYDRVRPHSRRFLDMQDEYRNQLLAQLIQLCIKSNCGTVDYREPTMPLRLQSWFAKNGIPFNWTEFLAALKFKLEQHGIELAKKTRMGSREYREARKGDASETIKT